MINIISFTRNGAKLCSEILLKLNEPSKGFTLEKFSKEFNLNTFSELSLWTEKAFKESKAIIFIGACGIAVRSIAPFIKSKTTDPAVIVIDEIGEHIIPLLSGHIGGANELALKLAKIIGGKAIISTATDINNRFSVDTFTVKNNLYIDNMKIAKNISSKVLEGEKIALSIDSNYKGKLPEDLTLDNKETGICISIYKKSPYSETLNLIPNVLTLGIGCRKNIELKNIEDAVFKVLEDNNVFFNSIEKMCSINIKKNEKGLIEFSSKYSIPFSTFTKNELLSAEGNFTSSDFVKSVTGVDNVCERAATFGSQGEVIVRKTCINGVTIALGMRKWGVGFEG